MGCKGIWGEKPQLVHFMWADRDDVCLCFRDRRHVQGKAAPLERIFKGRVLLTNLSFRNKWWILIIKRSWGCVVNALEPFVHQVFKGIFFCVFHDISTVGHKIFMS